MLKTSARLKDFFRECLLGLAGTRGGCDGTPERRASVTTIESEMERVRAVLAQIERGDALIEATGERERKDDRP